MVISFSHFSCWLRGGKKEQSVSKSATLNASSGLGCAPKKRESKKSHKVKETQIVPSPRKVHRRRKNREGDRIDREFDFVLVPSDGGECFSGSDSDDSEYTVGWVEPLGPRFNGVGGSDGGFAILIPLYSNGGKQEESSDNEILSSLKKLPDEFPSDREKYMEQWRAELKNFY